MRSRTVHLAGLAVAASSLAACGHPPSTHAGADDPGLSAVLTAQGWALTRVVAPGGAEHTAVPHSRISFFPDGRLLGSDTINEYNLTYRLEGRGRLTLGQFAVGAVGYVGDDPAQLATTEALDSLASGAETVTTEPTGGLDIKTAGGWLLVLRGDGRPPHA